MFERLVKYVVVVVVVVTDVGDELAVGEHVGSVAERLHELDRPRGMRCSGRLLAAVDIR